jgi:hypothetical protein
MKRNVIVKIPLNLPFLKGEVNNLQRFFVFPLKECHSIIHKTSLLLKPNLFSHFEKGGLRGIYYNHTSILVN